MSIQQIQPDVRLPKTKTIQRYVALLSQAGNFNPTVIELQNTTGQTVTWTRTEAGVYTSTLKIVGVGRSLLIANRYYSITLLGVIDTFATVNTTSADTGTLIDDVLNNTTVQIEIFTDYE